MDLNPKVYAEKLEAKDFKGYRIYRSGWQGRICVQARNVVKHTRIVMSHFFRREKLIGFLGSLGSKST